MPGDALDSRVALRCARRAHNDHDPTLAELPRVEVPLSRWATLAELPRVEVPLSRWAQRGIDFEDDVVAYLASTLGDACIDLRGLSHHEAVPATLEGMNSSVPVVIGGALPDDPERRRRGRPDLLVTGLPTDRGKSGYLPADIKSHQILRAARAGLITNVALAVLTDPAATTTQSGLGPSSSHRLTDLMQLAHYWRLL